MENTINSVKNKELSVKQAHEKFKILKSIIREKLNGCHPKSAGKATIFMDEVEVELKKWVLDCGDLGEPKTEFLILDAANTIIKLLKNPTQSIQQLSSQWFNMRTPQAVSKTRIRNLIL